MAAAVRFDNATVGYGQQPVVVGASFSIEPGQFLGLLGPNGAGKSTLVKSITGDAAVLAGQVHLLGRPLSDYSSRERARVLGVVPQSVAVPYAMTVREYVALGRSSHRGRLSEMAPADQDALARTLQLTDVDYLADKQLSALSGGELQRTAVAQALVSEPRALLLDEPTNHLDLRHRLALLDLIRDLVDQTGLAVLGVFHDFDLAARYSDLLSVVVPHDLVDGQITSAVTSPAPPAEVLTEDLISSVFAVEASVQHDALTGSIVVIPHQRGQRSHGPTG